MNTVVSELLGGAHIQGPLVVAEDLSFLRDYCRRLAYNRAMAMEDANEVVQETLIRVVRSEGWAEVVQKPLPVRRLYLKTTARRVMKDMAVKARRQSELAMEWVEMSSFDEEARQEAAHHLSELLPLSSEPELLVAYHLEGLEASEIIDQYAGKYGSSKEAVRQRVSRALKRLRDELDEQQR